MASPMPKVKINLSSGGRGSVEIDDQVVKGVVGIAFAVEGGKIPSVTLSIHGEIELTADEASVVTRYLETKPE